MKGAARHLTLTQRLLALIALAMVPMLAALLSFIASVHKEREGDARQTALRTSELASLEMDRIVSGVEGILEALAGAPTIRGGEPEACRAYLDDLTRRLPQLSGLLVADRNGTPRCTTAVGADIEAGSRRYFTEALESGRFTVGTYRRPANDGEPPFLPLAVPIRDGGAIDGVVVGGLDLDWLGRRLRERETLPGNSLTIADRDGIILAREPDDSEAYTGTPVIADFMPMLGEMRPNTVEARGRDGINRIVGYQPPATTQSGLMVSAGISTAEAFAPIYASTYRSLAIAGGGALAAFLVAWIVGNRLFRRPIRQLLDTVAAWRRGDIAARSGITPSGNELSTLAGAIDRYMDEVVISRAARDEAEAHRGLIVAEMEHRVKNLLATVQAMANQTFKGKAAPEAIETFSGRLASMAATHRVLLSENWERASLRATLDATFEPFGLGDRVSLCGPAIDIGARAALSLSMAAHELCTNAIKYGSLSHAAGTVEIAWDLSRPAGSRRLRLVWTERGGPPVSEPEESGFGTRMIRSALATQLDAEVELSFRPDGVVCTIDADAEKILADPDEP